MQQQGTALLRRAGADADWEEFDELASIFARTVSPPEAGQPPFRVGYAVRGKLMAFGEVGTTTALLALLRAMEQLPHWEALVHGEPEDLLDCEVLFTRA